MKKLINFFYENENDEILQVDIREGSQKYPIIDVNYDDRSIRRLIPRGKKNLLWSYDKTWIRVQSNEGLIDGYPSVDLNYVIAIYKSVNSEFKAPQNAVIYNLDGTIHKVLNIPILESSNVLKRIAFNKDSNPPIESAPFQGGLYFSGFDWDKTEGGDLINRIQIIYDRDWIEWRELHPETGQVGKYIGQGRL